MELTTHKRISEICNELLYLLNGLELIEAKKFKKDLLIVLKERHNLVLEKFNNENYFCVNPTKTELGIFRASVKKIIYANFYKSKVSILEDKKELLFKIYNEKECEYFCKCNNCKKIEEVRNEITWINFKVSQSCEKTNFGDLERKTIYLNRQIENQYRLTDLERSAKEIIHTEIKEIYKKQNIKLINKINNNEKY